MIIGSSSDDPDVNDVLYWGGTAACITYGGPSRANPYPPNYSLGNYETGSVFESYTSATTGGSGARTTGPTNAGFVPYAPQVMYAARGFGYYTSQAANTGNVVVGMQSSGAAPTPASVAAAIATFTPYLKP